MKQRVLTAVIGIPIVLACMLCTNPWPFGILVALIALGGIREAFHLVPSPLSTSLPEFFGLLLWILIPLASLITLQTKGSPSVTNLFSPNLVLLPIGTLWIGDSAAYFVGKAFGKHPMAPKISPKKTWEGGVANLLACILAAWGIGTWLGIPTIPAMICGLISGILGQIGDLFQSHLKRNVGLKDSGALLPGHGGVLDRIDSLLMSAIPICIILISAKNR
ncbi:MAG: phosphatidate cytidylyltransferase [Armatimonadetes bacterium]|nr:phosphatidate cytidylyltransferase [Armatimonadota bacterium]